MTTHSSLLAWRMPRTEEPGGLQSLGLQSRTRLSTPHIYIKHDSSEILPPNTEKASEMRKLDPG